MSGSRTPDDTEPSDRASEVRKATNQNYAYVGRELDLAAEAVNWKRYWGSKAKPYLGPRVLEVGAGLGANIAHLCGDKQRYWLALEPDEKQAERIDACKTRGELPGVCHSRVGTLSDLEAAETFDTILYVDVLEHIQDDTAEVALAARHLNAGGFLVVLAPAHQALFSALDTALGHYRRYNRASLLALTPPELIVDKCIYLDSLGVLASLANRFALKAEVPTAAQYKLWDQFMIRISRVVDPFLGHRVGKSILAIWQKK